MCDKSSSTTKSSSTSTQTATPVVPSWISNPDQAYAAQVAGLQASAGDGTQFVAPASALQQQGFTGAAGLGSWQDTLKSAIGQVNTAIGTPTPTVTATGYGSTGYGATGYGATGYTPATIKQAAQIAATGGASAGTATASLIKDLIAGKGLQDYSDPYTGAVVDTTLAGLDKTNGGDLASFDAQAALNRSFGGSGATIGRTNLVSSQALGRAQEEATLRSAGFDKATALASQDASALTGVSTANAANQTQASVATAQLAAARATAQAQLEQQTTAANQGALNAAGEYGATASNTANQFGATALNAANQFGAAALNTTNQFGAAADNTAAAQNQNATLQMIQDALSGASITAGIGNNQASNSINDVTAQLAAGATQRGLDADTRTAPLTMLQTLQSLLGYNPGQFIGQTSTGSSSGTNTTTVSPSLLQDLQSLSQTSQGFSKAFNPGT